MVEQHKKVSVAICLACFNRRVTTLRCLNALRNLDWPNDTRFEIYLADDASPDRTADMVRERFPEVTLLHGDGNLFWGGGMRLAFGRAMEVGHDFYVWLNDDVELYPRVFFELFSTYALVSNKGRQRAMVAGATCDPDTGALTYSGRVQTGISPLTFRNVEPKTDKPQICDTMNGNLVLIPAQVATELGNIDATFTQHLGDFDYGLRAKRLGIRTWVCMGFVGTCRPNTKTQKWKSAEFSFRQRLAIVNSALGLPFAQWMVFCARHGGLLGIIFGLIGYRNLLFPKKVIRNGGELD